MRASGILLPIFSLPSPYGIGSLGKSAFEFVDFLHEAGQKFWQILPLGPTGYADSPYQSFSSFASNGYFLDLDLLKEEGLLLSSEYENIQWSDKENKVDYGILYNKRYMVLKKAMARFDFEKKDFKDFSYNNNYWLDDYGLFMSLKDHFEGEPWHKWPEDIRNRSQKALEEYGTRFSQDILLHKFVQFMFFKQWENLKTYANKKNISIIGDIPIYTSLDSSDVWSRYHLFQTDKNRNISAQAGVPPDAFSTQGQLWGNPLYDWEEMEKEDFYWWRQRINIASQLYDYVRIDHFIGIERYFSVPADATTAKDGIYKKGPGMKLIKAIDQAKGNMKIIAEDLGVLTKEVVDLLEASTYPGMKVLQFAFSQDPSNIHLPTHHKINSIAYTGTHDNDTTRSWLKDMTKADKKFLKTYLNKSFVRVKDIIFETMKSVSFISIVPMQDWLNQDKKSRINYPSVTHGNWTYRISNRDLKKKLADKILDFTKITGR